MEKSKTALMAIPTKSSRNVSRAGSSTGISALQSMGSTLKGTISLLMNKTCILNFLNEIRELFDQGIYIYTGIYTINYTVCIDSHKLEIISIMISLLKEENLFRKIVLESFIM